MKIIKECYRLFLVKARRLRLGNRNFSIISNNCCGGIISHDLGERFYSPTINLFIRTPDYFLFLEHLEECLSAPVTEGEREGEQYPVGCITLESGETVKLHFMHYKTFAEAESKWRDRCRRVDYDNLFIFMEAGIETTDDIVHRFESLKYANKVIITNKKYDDCPHACWIDIYGDDYNYGKLIKYKPHTLYSKRYLDHFDYIGWLNHRPSRTKAE